MSNDSTKSFVIDGITYTASPLSETRWSVRVEDPDECDAINNGPVNWADVDAVSEALGVPVRFVDGGDHPTAIESIYEIAKIKSGLGRGGNPRGVDRN